MPKVEVIWKPPKDNKPKESADSVIRVAAYCRTSTVDDEMIKSLQNQIHHYTRYINSKKDFKLIGIYCDKGVSGLTKDKRPGFMRLLRHCEEGKIDLILTKSVSRFSRNSKDLLEVIHRLKELDVKVIFQKENIDTSKVKNEFYITALAAIAQEEIRTLSETTQWGYEKRFLKGIPCLKPQFGYYVQENKKDPIVIINEEEAATVREIFDLFIAGMKKSTIAWLMMLNDLKSMNRNDHFEYHRLLFFSELETAEDNQNYEARERIEQKILKFEELATKLEADREYRDKAIAWMEKTKSLEKFIGDLNIEYMRAWILSITIFAPDAYIIRWLDNTETKIGECIAPAKPPGNTFAPGQTALKKDIKLETAKEVQVMEAAKAVKAELNPSISVSKNVKKEYEHYAGNLDYHSIVKTDKPKIRVAAYCRISTHISHQLGSLATQMAYYTYYILKNPNYSFVQIYADEGISGTKAENRKEFQRMISDCKAGRVDRIVTKSISRFARNTVDCLEYIRMLKALPNPVSVFFEREGIDTLDEDSEIMLTVYSGLAQEESRSLAESISWGKRKLAQRGIFNPSQKRYGYDYDPDGNWVINPAQAEIIRRMYHDLIAGKNTSRIAKELSEEGIETVRGNKIWSSRTIDCMIRNPIYAGRFIYQRFYVKDTLKGRAVENHGELPQYLIEDHHPAIISPETWEAAQLIMKNRSSKKKKPAKAHTRQEFFNIFCCSECGGPVMHTTSSRTGAHYWRCKAAEVKRALTMCGVRGFREESIEHAFMAMLQEMKKSNRLATETGKAIEDTIPSEDERIKIEEVKQEMQHFYQELYQTVEAGSKYGGDPDKIKKLTDKIVNFQNQINKLNDRKEKAGQMQKDLKWLLKELEGIMEFDPEKERIEFRADIFSRIVEKATIFPDGRIIYDLRLGIQWSATGNDRKAWRLKMKKSKKN